MAAVAVLALVALGALTLLHRGGATAELDGALLQWLRTVRAPWLDVVGGAIELLFQPAVSFVAAVGMSLWLWRTGPRYSWAAPLAIAFVLLAEAVLRNGWANVLRPGALVRGVSALFGAHYHAAGSFPSGHVARATFLAVIALSTMRRQLAVPVTIFAALSVPARLYTESHLLSDVLGGGALGVGVAASALWTTDAAARHLVSATRWLRALIRRRATA